MNLKEFFKNPQYDSLKTVGLIVVVGFLGVFLYTHNFLRVDQTGRALNGGNTTGPAQQMQCSPHYTNNGNGACTITNANCSTSSGWLNSSNFCCLSGQPSSTETCISNGINTGGSGTSSTVEGRGVVNKTDNK